jgi:electron transport complex protein RnfD
MAKEVFPNKLVIGASPHLRDKDSIPKIMWSVNIALLPALLVGVAYFGWYAALVVAVSVFFAVLSEYACQKFRGIPVTIADGSAVVTGVLLAFTLPPNVPLYLPAIGAVFAIAIAKHAFGGLGCNIWNPALAARAFLLAAYSGFVVMSKWPMVQKMFSGYINSVDVITKATPCAVLKETPLKFFEHYSIADLVLGKIPGSIGETSAIALLIGGFYLIMKKYVNWRLPLSYILTVAVMVFLLPFSVDEHIVGFWQASYWADAPLMLSRILAHVFSGGLILGAFFMASDMVTSPLSNKGQALFGIGCGVLVAIIRLYGGYPEGVCYSILIMNTAVWVFDKYSKPKLFGIKISSPLTGEG